MNHHKYLAPESLILLLNDEPSPVKLKLYKGHISILIGPSSRGALHPADWKSCNQVMSPRVILSFATTRTGKRSPSSEPSVSKTPNYQDYCANQNDENTLLF